MSDPQAPLRVSVTALGCRLNYAEMAELAGTLAAAGCDVVADTADADVRVLNSCSVTQQADATTRQRLRILRRQSPGAHLIVTGCSVSEHREIAAAPELVGADAAFDNVHKGDIAAAVLRLAGRRRGGAAGPMERRARAFLKVQDGCRHRCTYCSVWRARGPSVSRTPEEVRERAHGFVAQGYREIVLTGVDLGSYGRDLGTDLEHLLRALLDELPATHRIRLSSINSNDVTPGLIRIAAHPSLCRQWHLPLQSGSDAVLRAMHRGYRSDQYRRTVDALRAVALDVEITSDVMAGFPGESEADHAATLQLVSEVGMLDAHVFRWSARDDTAAAALPDRVPAEVARRRAREIAATAARSRSRQLAARVGTLLDVIWIASTDSGASGLGAGGQQVVRESRAARGALERVHVVDVDGDALVAAAPPG